MRSNLTSKRQLLKSFSLHFITLRYVAGSICTFLMLPIASADYSYRYCVLYSCRYITRTYVCRHFKGLVAVGCDGYDS